MAGDWIKIRHALPGDPSVFSISHDLSMSTDAVLGKLVRFWIWCDTHLDSCALPKLTKSDVDALLCAQGFADSMILAGWLHEKDGGLEIPNFEYHLSKSSKRRGLHSKRVCAKRALPKRTKSALEKRREEKSNKNPKAPKPNPEKSTFEKQADEIWTLWRPKKKAKTAKVAIVKALSRVPFDRLVAAVTAYQATKYVQTRLGTDNETFIPLCATWMNGDEWENETTEDPAARRKRENAYKAACVARVATMPRSVVEAAIVQLEAKYPAQRGHHDYGTTRNTSDDGKRLCVSICEIVGPEKTK